MKALLIYDPVYGNTEIIARAIGDALTAAGAQVHVHRPAEATPAEAHDGDLLIVGAPTQAGRATATVKEYLAAIPANALAEVKVAAFDTRMTADKAYLKAITKVFGFAGGRIARALQDKGGKLVLPAEGFIVKDSKGPLADGEVKRAGEWAAKLFEAAK